MNNPWDVKPRSPAGNPNIDEIYVAVGRALTCWENLEAGLGELFDAAVGGDGRAGFAAFAAVSSSSARTELLSAALPRALSEHGVLLGRASALVEQVGKFGARRNEIAHGRVFDLMEHGFYLCPTNINPRKWTGAGAAKYQYRAEDISAYASEFVRLHGECAILVADIRIARGL
tara:strand:- start:953 stop:1474 length:522 start_codon:yes stop_codon:yes gene_type:complete